MLGRALAMEWMSRDILLEAAICVTGNLLAYPCQCIQAGYWGQLGVVFKQPVIILHVSLPYIRCKCSVYVVKTDAVVQSAEPPFTCRRMTNLFRQDSVSKCLGPFKCYVMQWGWEGVKFPRKKQTKVYGSMLLPLRGGG